jgi:hypothetical protein
MLVGSSAIIDLLKILGIVAGCTVVVLILSWWDGRF